MKKLFTSAIKCKVYAPMVGKVQYFDREGIPKIEPLETQFEIGSKYTVVSPLSPYAIGWNNWQKLVDGAGGRDLADVYKAEVDFDQKTITVYQKEAA
jgi:hypothetical protein